MIEQAPYYPTGGYASPSLLWSRYLTDPVRLASVLLGTLILGYGARIENSSPFTIPFLEAFIGGAFSGIEIIILILPALELIRRLVLSDYVLERSPASRSVITLGFVAGVYPFFHMLWSSGFRIPYEILYLPFFIVMFFTWLFMFRRTELLVMVWMVLAAALFKTIEGISIFLTQGVIWGLLTGWRDAMLLSLVIIGTLFAFIIKPEEKGEYQTIRKFLFVITPLTMFTFVGAMRRSYMIGIVIAIFILFFFLNRVERARFRKFFPLMALLFVIGVIAIGLEFFTDRFSGVSNPTQEGSAAWRLIEAYNVSNMIVERPIFGWPMGTEFKNYTFLDLPPISTLIPHNVYLYMMLRAGIFGIAAWLLMLIVMSRIHIRTIRAAVTPLDRFLSLWLASSTILIFFTGFTTPVVGDRLLILYPFLMVMTSFLPGAWSKRKATYYSDKWT